LRVAKYLKYDPRFDLFDLRAALAGHLKNNLQASSLAKLLKHGEDTYSSRERKSGIEDQA
jgi:hypothetical protein